MIERVKQWISRAFAAPDNLVQASYRAGARDLREWGLSRELDPSKRTRKNIDAILGYQEDLTYRDYLDEYRRNPMAAAVINRPVKDSWISHPRVYESDEDETPFEQVWEKTLDNIPVWAKLSRLDRIACLGHYAVLVIGTTQSGADFSKPPKRGGELAFLTVIDEENATIRYTESNPASPRYGLPILYRLVLSNYENGVTTTATYDVHWERVIHVAEGALTNDLFGTPRLEAIYNRLISSEIVGGGGAEMFFRGAYPGIAVKSTTDNRLEADDVMALQERLASFANNLERYILLEGMDLNEISPQVSSPLQHDDVINRHISAASDIPQRILLGSERGQLASDQDERAWAANIETRRQQYLIPFMIRPLVDRLIMLGILPAPEDNYFIEWMPFGQMSPPEQADVGLKHTEALAKYVSAPGAEDLLPPELFLKRELGMTDGEVEVALKMTEDQQWAEIDNQPESLPEDEPTISPDQQDIIRGDDG